ncbi:MAG: phosphatase PAP2 family protein [Fimbriimonadales bacterium]
MDWVRDFDEAVLRAINQGLHCGFCDFAFWVFSSLGIGFVQLLLSLPMAFFSSLRRVWLLVFVSWAVSGGLVQAVKAVSPRLRPTNDPATIVTPGELLFKSSFPSGHTATSFAIAFALFLAWPGEKRRMIGVSALVVAVLVGVSRVYRGVHWPTDVIGGMLLGCGTAFLVAFVFETVLRRSAK